MSLLRKLYHMYERWRFRRDVVKALSIPGVIEHAKEGADEVRAESS